MRSKFLPLPALTLRAMVRRRWASLSIILMIALGVFASIVLHQLTKRQEIALEKMIDTTEITCIVTDTRGMNSGNLEMYSLWVDKLFGKHGETVADYICNIHAAGTVELAEPMGVSLRKILDIASEEAFSSLEGSGVTFYDGYDESVFRTDARVCLVPNEMKVNDDGIVKVRREGMETVELTVIGTVSGAGKNIVWCPFYTPVDGDWYLAFPVDSCSFSIRDNRLFDETKEAIYQYFVVPSLSAIKTNSDYGVMIRDELYRSTLEKIESNIQLLGMMLPVLIVLCCFIGFFTSFLSTRGREKEFAVMRCLGMSPIKVFLLVFEEFVILAALGGAVGFAGGYLFERSLPREAVEKAFIILGVYLVGAAISVLRICNVNVMKLMKVED